MGRLTVPGDGWHEGGKVIDWYKECSFRKGVLLYTVTLIEAST